jgi:integrase
MADLYKRDDSPYWWHAYEDTLTGQRKRRSTGQSDKRAARLEMQVFLRQQLDMRARGVSETMTLDRCLAEHFEEQKARKRAGLENMRAYWHRLCGRQEGRAGLDPTMSLEKLTSARVSDLKLIRMREGYAANTINHEIKFLAAAWRRARDRKVLVADPAPRFPLEKAPEKRRVLTPEQFHAVLALLDPAKPIPTRGGGTYVPPPGSRAYCERSEVRDLFIVLCLTGARWGEVAKMTWDMVEDEALRIYGWKTGRARLVPLADLTREVIARRRPDGLYVFPGKGGRVRSGPSRAIRRALDLAGVNAPHIVARDGKATVHTLRHTFATWILRDTGDLAATQDLLGHSDPATTRIYTRLAGSDAAVRTVGVLNRLVGPARAKSSDLLPDTAAPAAVTPDQDPVT